MIEEQAVVIAVNQELITVQSQVKSTCSSCQQVDTCGSGLVAKALPKRKLTLDLTTSLDVKVGDKVTLAIPESDLLQTAWQVYLWPLIGLILFSAIGQSLVQSQILPHEILAIIMGSLGGYLGYRIAGFRLKSSNQSLNLLPKIINVDAQNIPITEIIE
ncbi:MAG: SoxR reducing system RseC family protein [Alteromonadaceae bacterium]|nr:SoxR reducing system RseC family protein [Alteromonadaceae bacterium]